MSFMSVAPGGYNFGGAQRLAGDYGVDPGNPVEMQGFAASVISEVGEAIFSGIIGGLAYDALKAGWAALPPAPTGWENTSGPARGYDMGYGPMSSPVDGYGVGYKSDGRAEGN